MKTSTLKRINDIIGSLTETERRSLHLALHKTFGNTIEVEDISTMPWPRAEALHKALHERMAIEHHPVPGVEAARLKKKIKAIQAKLDYTDARQCSWTVNEIHKMCHDQDNRWRNTPTENDFEHSMRQALFMIHQWVHKLLNIKQEPA